MNFNFFLDVFFPQRCLRCRGAVKNGVICGNCREGIKLHASLFCGKCKARLSAPKKICHRDFPYILGAAGAYGDETVKTLVHALKFRGVRDAAEPLAEIMAEYAQKTNMDIAGYHAVPIPLSARRERERGFNQSELIGTLFAARAGIPIETKTLVRIRHTAPQSSTESAAERMKNVLGCFGAAADSMRGMDIILIDDVTTSGATFLEAARAAKNAGAGNIVALAAAMV